MRLANKRVNSAIKAIRLVGNLSNRGNYEYSAEDAAAIARALEKELKELRRRFGSADGSDGGDFHLAP